MGTAGAERTHRGDCSTPGAGRDRDHRVAGNPGRTRRSGDWNSAQCGIDVSDPPFQNGGCLQRTPPGQRGGLGANRARRRVSGGGFFQSAEGQSGRNLKSGEQAARLMVLFSFNLAYGNGLERTPVRSSFCVRGPSRFASAFFTAVAACPPARLPHRHVHQCHRTQHCRHHVEFTLPIAWMEWGCRICTPCTVGCTASLFLFAGCAGFQVHHGSTRYRGNPSELTEATAEILAPRAAVIFRKIEQFMQVL